MNEAEIDQAIDNWRRWFRDKPTHERAKSLEGRYVGELGDVIEGIRAASVPDMRQAIKVERAWVRMPEPYKHILCVHTFYPGQLRNNNFYKFCRKNSIRQSDFGWMLQRSKMMLKNLLTRA